MRASSAIWHTVIMEPGQRFQCFQDRELLLIAHALLTFLQEEILEETAGLDGPVLAPTPPSTPSNTSEATPTPPSTPKRNSEAKDANPWEASWGDLLSSQESDSEFDTDSSQSSTSGASTANAADSSLKTGAPASTPDAQAEATGSSLTKTLCKHACCL